MTGILETDCLVPGGVMTFSGIKYSNDSSDASAKYLMTGSYPNFTISPAVIPIPGNTTPYYDDNI